MNYPGSLHNHTDYSNIRGRDAISTIKGLVDYALELGHEVIAFTEHDCLSGAIKVEEYYDEVKKEHPGFKVIRGNEIYLVRDGLNSDNYDPQTDRYFHFILLARDAIGHKQIREISTRAWMRSYMARGLRRVPTYYSDLKEVIGDDRGHVLATTACLGGSLPVHLLRHRDNPTKKLHDDIVQWCRRVRAIFGDGNFFFEMQPSDNPDQIYVNQELLKLSRKLRIPYLISLDAHYVRKEDAEAHEIYLKSQNIEREVSSFYATTHLMGTEELEGYFPYMSREELDEAYRTTLSIKDMCEDYTLKKPLKIPHLKWKDVPQQDLSRWEDDVPWLKTFEESGFEGDRLLVQAIFDRVSKDERLQAKEIYDEINVELESVWKSSEVNKAHWSSYLLNLQNIIDTCWRSGTIVGCGRGSGVGFLLLYLLDITQINPLWEKAKTFHWRFLNPSRVSVLDVDVDISGLRREQVLEGLREEYGRDRVANVATFGTEKARSAVLSAARGLGIDNDVSQYIAGLIPSDRGIQRSLSQCYFGDADNPPVQAFVDEMARYPKLWEVARKIEGLISRVGIHAGGVIFVDEPFTEGQSLMRAPDGTVVTCFELHDSEKISNIKYDVLSVEAIDRIQTCLELLCRYGLVEEKPTLKETYESVIGIYSLERDAPEMWEMVWNHQIQSLFQMEKQSGIQGIALTHPKSVEDLSTLNSAIRLMAQEKGAEQPLDKYARFKQDPSLWEKEMDSIGLSDHEKELLHDVLDISYGMCINQEQFMELVQIPECGGFDLNFADRLRRAISKKNPKQFDELEEEFLKNIDEKGLNERFCRYIWFDLIYTTRGYGF